MLIESDSEWLRPSSSSSASSSSSSSSSSISRSSSRSISDCVVAGRALAAFGSDRWASAVDIAREAVAIPGADYCEAWD